MVTLLDELQALGVAFVSLQEGIDATTPAGKLQMHILAAIAEFERARIAERVKAGLARVKSNGQPLGRPPVEVSAEAVDAVRGFSVREAARRLGVSRSTAHIGACPRSRRPRRRLFDLRQSKPTRAG